MPKKKAVKRVKPVVRATKKTVKTRKAKARVGAGRPKGTGKFGCETKAVRLPVHLIDEINAFVLRKLKAEKKK